MLLCSWRAAGQICRARGSIRARWPYFWTFTSALVMPAHCKHSPCSLYCKVLHSLQFHYTFPLIDRRLHCSFRPCCLVSLPVQMTIPAHWQLRPSASGPVQGCAEASITWHQENGFRVCALQLDGCPGSKALQAELAVSAHQQPP